MFSNKTIPDALFVANDHMDFAAMDIIRYDLKLKIPDEVSIVGYDDVPPSAWPSYDLTTVKQKADLLVEETVRILLESIEGKDKRTKKLKIDGPLVLRNSTRKRF